MTQGGNGNPRDFRWFVAHTRPRCEKKLAQYCERDRVEVNLPVFRSVRRYRGKEIIFSKPFFSGYLFLRLVDGQEFKVRQNLYCARLLEVPEQAEFQRQLEGIMMALDSGLSVRLEPQIGPGMRVLIRHGALRGLEGWVEERHGLSEVLLRLDFIGQAAAVRVDAEHLELT